MTGPPHRPGVQSCARCSNLAVVVLAVDAVDPTLAVPIHHTTVLAVCDDHVPAAVGVILAALNARPTIAPKRDGAR